jgi:hypothetical protein
MVRYLHYPKGLNKIANDGRTASASMPLGNGYAHDYTEIPDISPCVAAVPHSAKPMMYYDLWIWSVMATSSLGCGQ